MHCIITHSTSTAGVEGDERVCRAGIGDPDSGDGMIGAGRVVGDGPTAEPGSGQPGGCTEWPQTCREGTKKPAKRWLYHLYQWVMCYNSCEALFV